MISNPISRVRIAAWILGCVGLAIAASAAHAQAPAGGVQTAGGAAVLAVRETPSSALARHMRSLATSPKNFEALIGAGNAALEMGDIQAAAGFFGRADEVWPRSPLPQVGMGAALVAEGDAQAALPHFTRAQQLGANAAMLGKDRGLAYDLLGRHAEAQNDYRAAFYGPDPDEARRRLALSLAISGRKDEALAQLAPLSTRGDAAASRVRALVLALGGDAEGARRAMDFRMPGSGAQMAAYFRRLPSLRSDQKAAAVHLGIFPGDAPTGYAIASAAPPAPVPMTSQRSFGPAPAPQAAVPRQHSFGASPAPQAKAPPPSSRIDQVQSVDQWLQQPPSPRAGPAQTAAEPVRMASVSPPQRTQLTSAARRQPQPAADASAKEKIWLQLASGKNAEALPDQFRRIKSRHKDILDGISGYVAEEPAKARLLIGPFKSKSDAQVFAQDLESVSVDAFSWTSAPGQTVRKLPIE